MYSRGLDLDRMREHFFEKVAFNWATEDEELVRRKVGGKVFQERKQCVAGM